MLTKHNKADLFNLSSKESNHERNEGLPFVEWFFHFHPCICPTQAYLLVIKVSWKKQTIFFLDIYLWSTKCIFFYAFFYFKSLIQKKIIGYITQCSLSIGIVLTPWLKGLKAKCHFHRNEQGFKQIQIPRGLMDMSPDSKLIISWVWKLALKITFLLGKKGLGYVRGSNPGLSKSIFGL